MAIGVGGHSPSNIAQHLKHIHFPCSRDDLVRQAQTNKAEEDIIDVLRQMPEQQYHTMADVMKGVGVVE